MRPRQVEKAGPRPASRHRRRVSKGRAGIHMPEKDNPTKQIAVAPRFFLSSSTEKVAPVLSETLPVPERRALVASYVTGQDNPWFARAFINRVWYALMGETFYEPDRRHRPRARRPRPPKCSTPWPSNGRRGATIFAGSFARY